MNDDCPYCDYKDGMNINHICIDPIAKEKIDRVVDECEALEDELQEANKFCEIFKKSQIEFEQRIQDLESKFDMALKAGEAWKKEALKLKDDVSILKEALGFYASFESDENGFGGVNGDGLYVVIMSGFYVLDKGKTAQNALKKLGGNYGA